MSNAAWMFEMAAQIGNRSLRNITLPGTHDSGTYDIGATSSFSTDSNGQTLNMVDDVLLGTMTVSALVTANPILLPMSAFLTAAAGGGDAVFREAVANYSRTQSQSVYNQLLGGVRYLDLRVCVQSNQIYTCHGMQGAPISTVLSDVAKFQQAYPKEIVLLDFNHFYSFSGSWYQTLVNEISSALGAAIVPSTISQGLNVTPNQLWQGSGRIIVFFRDDQTPSDANVATAAAANPSVVWGAGAINSQWFSEVDDVSQLYTAMVNEYNDPANAGRFWVNQGIVSPQAYVPYILQHLFSSLYSEAQTITPAVADWIHYLWGGMTPPLNVVIVNFFEMGNFVDAIRGINQSPSSAWVSPTSPANTTVGVSSLYADLSAVTCAEGHVVTGISFVQSNAVSGTSNGNRLLPVLATAKLDGSGQTGQVHGEASGAYSTQLKNLYIDTTPLLVPEGFHVVGFQFVVSSTSNGFPNSNRLVPVLICQDAEGKNQTEICNKQGNDDYTSLSSAQMITEELSIPQGGAIGGFQFVLTSANSGYAVGGQIAPALLYDVNVTANVQAIWNSSAKVTSGAISESAGTWFNCAQGQLMVGRKHDGDENGDTWYYTAPIHFVVPQGNNKTNANLQIEPNSTSQMIVESAGAFYESGKNCAMTGRWHGGDENGNTQYKDSTISFPTVSSTKTVIGMRRWTPNIKESNSDFTCQANAVLTGRWHDGDENGNTRYEYAFVFVLPE